MANETSTTIDPDRWWHGGVFYQIYPRSYADSNGDGIGDLPGIIGKLDHLARLGITGVWLSPVTCSPNRDWGYDVSNYRDIDPSYGTLDDLDTLVREGAARGIHILMDLVPNHTSNQHAWFVDAQSGRDSTHRDYYVWADPKPDGSPPNNWVSIFGGPAWELDEASGQFYLHNFEAQQPDLNWWSDDVRREFDDIVRFWWDRGVAGFRIDVCNMMIKDKELRDNPPATEDDPIEQQFMGVRYVYNSDRPEAHDILRHWRTIADTYEPQRLLIGETNVETLERLSLFYGGGRDELHGGFNFQFMHAPLEAAKMREVVEGTEALLPEGSWPTWHGSNHDFSRLTTRWAGGDPAKVKVALLILLSLRGTAVPLRRRRDRPARRRRAQGPPARPGRRPLLPVRGARQRTHADGVEQRAQRWLQCARRADVATHDRSDRLQRGRPGRRSGLGTRDLPPLHRGAHGVGRPRRRLLHLVALARGHLGLPARCGHDGAAQHVGRPRHVLRRARLGAGGDRRRPGGSAGRRRAGAAGVEWCGRGGLTMTWGAATPVQRRYLLCATPALGHTAPLLALSRRLVEQGDEVAFYTTPHYEERVTATGAEFLPFEEAFDAHDLMVVNPEREASAKRGVGGVKDDLRRIFVGPVPGQARDIDTILEAFAADCVVVDSMFLGAIPLSLRPRSSRPAVACVGVMPYSQPSRDTAPFGIGMQPGRGPLARLRNRTLNWLAVHVAVADIERFTRARLAEAGAPGVKTPLLDLQPTLTDALLPGDGQRVRVSAFGPGADGALRGADPGAGVVVDLVGVVHLFHLFVGFLVDLPRAPFVVAGPVRRPPRGARHPGHARQRRPGPAPAPHHRRAVRRRRPGRRHHRWPGTRTVPL